MIRASRRTIERSCLSTKQLAREHTRGQKSQPDDQTGSPLFENIAKLVVRSVLPLGKIIMHSGFKEVLRIGVRRKLIHMNYQRHGIASRKFPGPADNKFFRVVIEIPFVERRRIHRVEQLLDSIDKNFDSMVGSVMRLQVGNSFKPL